MLNTHVYMIIIVFIFYFMVATAVGAVLSKQHSNLGRRVVLINCNEKSTCETTQRVTTTTTTVDASTLLTVKKLVSNEKFHIQVAQNFIPTLIHCQQKIEDQLKVHHTVIHIDKAGCQLTVIPCIGNELVEGWHSKCKAIVKAFIDNLIVDTLAIPVEKRELMKPIIDSTRQTETSLHVEHVEDRCVVMLAGEPKEVNKIKKKLDDICKTIIDETVLIKDERFFLLLAVKLNELLSANQEVKATINADSCHIITITGFKAKCEEFKGEIFKMKDTMQCIPVLVTSPLAQFLSSEAGQELLKHYLLMCNFRSEVATYFDLEGKLFVLGTASSTAPKHLATKIQNNLCYTCVAYPPLFHKSLQSKEWSEFYCEVVKRHSVQLSVVKNEIKILGDLKLSSLAKKEIELFINGECQLERSFTMCNAQWRFFLTHMAKKWRNLEKRLQKDSRKTQLSVPEGINDKDPCIIIKGEKPTIEALEKSIEEILASIISSTPIRLLHNSVVSYFSSSIGMSAIQQCERDEKCCIQVDIEDASIDPSLNNSIISTGQCNKVCTETTPGGLKVSLYQGDITALPVDVIINYANPKLKHTTAVASVLANKGEACMQEESNALLEMTTNIKEGDAIVMKKVGNFSCKYLMYIVIPYWKGGTQNEGSLLKSACLKALEKAQNFQTISLPAIDSHTHSFPISLCAENMVKAVVDFSLQNPACSLSEVAFVLRHQFEVDAFHKEMSQVFSSSVATGTTRTVNAENLSSKEDGIVVKEKDLVFVEDHFGIVCNNKSKITDDQSSKTGSIVAVKQSTRATSSNINIDITKFVQVCKGDLLNQQVSV